MSISVSYRGMSNFRKKTQENVIDVKIDFAVNNQYGRVANTIASLRPQPATLDILESWKEDQRNEEHVEIKLIRHVLEVVSEENARQVSREEYSSVIQLYRLKPSELSMGSVYSLLSILVPNKEPDSYLDEDEITLWNKINSITNINSILRKYASYSPKSYKRSFVTEFPDFLIEVILSSLENANLQERGVLFDFRNDAKNFPKLYRTLKEFEEKYKRFDCNYYTLISDKKLKNEFKKHLMPPSEKADYFKLFYEAMFNHPLTKKVINYHLTVLNEMYTVIG